MVWLPGREWIFNVLPGLCVGFDALKSVRRVTPNKVWLFLTPLFCVALVYSISVGALDIPASQIMEIFWQHLFDDAETMSLEHRIVIDVRLPRVLLVCCVGSLLAISGAAMQGLFRNPLADPSLIGVTAGAVAGAGTVIVLLDSFSGAGSGEAFWGVSALMLGAFIGGVLAVLLVYRLATSVYGTSVSTMLLAGIAITALAGSYSGLLEYIADSTMLRRISLWRMGGFGSASYTQFLLAATMTCILLVVLRHYAESLNALLLGESEARHLGVDVQKLKIALIVWVALAVGVSVALAGAIAFVGLVVPHIVRLLIGPDHRFLIPLSALIGALLLLLSDITARIVVSPAELPIGIVTAALGAPFFISLLRQRQAYGLE